MPNYTTNMPLSVYKEKYLNFSDDDEYDTDSDEEFIHNGDATGNNVVGLETIVEEIAENNEHDCNNINAYKDSIDTNGHENFKNLSGTMAINVSKNIDVSNKTFISPLVTVINNLKNKAENNQEDENNQNAENSQEDEQMNNPHTYILSTKETFSDRLNESINDELKTELKEKCYDTYFISTHFTTKMVGRCMLSDEQYTHDEIKQNKIPCLHHLQPHHSYGSVWYHPKYENLFQYVTRIAEIDLNLIMKHNLQNRILKVKRTSGEIQEIRWSFKHK